MIKEKNFMEVMPEAIELANNINKLYRSVFEKLLEYKCLTHGVEKIEDIKLEEIQQIYLAFELISLVTEVISSIPWENFFEQNRFVLYLIDFYDLNGEDQDIKRKLNLLREGIVDFPIYKVVKDREIPESILNNIQNFKNLFTKDSNFINGLSELQKINTKNVKGVILNHKPKEN